MSSSTRMSNKLVIGLVLVTAAATAALADQRGPIQANFETVERTVSNPVTTEVSASEDGLVQGSHVAPADRNGRHLLQYSLPGTLPGSLRGRH